MHDDNELFAAEAGHHIGSASIFTEDRGDSTQTLISGDVAIVVVESLKWSMSIITSARKDWDRIARRHS